ncbi:MAG: cytochrome c3 family protein [Gemmatimonadota bacterium]
MSRARIVLSVVVAALGLLARPPAARAEDFYSQERCSLCHIRESVFFSPGFASPEVLKAFGEERVCYSCHNGAVRDSRDVLWRGAQHPPPRPGDRAGGKRCSPCHSPHAKGGWSVLAGTGVPIRTGGDAVCTKCHRGYERAAGPIHRTGFPEGGCAECHRAHGGAGRSLLRVAGGALCLGCHPDAGSGRSGGHPVASAAAASSARKTFPECVECHPVHPTRGGAGAVDSRCAGCHDFGKGRAAGKKRHPSEAKCTECHSFHRLSAANGKGLRAENVKADLLCGGCHARQAAENLNKARQRGTHPSGAAPGGKALCLSCHRIHDGAPGTALLASDKAYSCLECHDGQNTISEVAGIVLAHPVFERLEKGRLAAAAKARHLVLGPGGEIVCRTCHSVHRASPDTALLVPGTASDGSCLWCHDRKDAVGHFPAAKAPSGPRCGTCHPVHGKRPPAGGTGAADPWAMLCTGCHPQAASHVPGLSRGADGRPADMPVFDGRGRRIGTGAVSCPTCHEPHGKPGRKRLRRAYAASGFVCTACHREKETIALTPHDLRGISGRSICEPCHRPHGGRSPGMWGLSSDAAEGEWQTCRSCHRDKGLGQPVPPGGHPVDVVASRPVPEKFPLFGTGGRKARTGVLTCSTCHEVHGTGFLPLGEVTGMLLRAEATQEDEDVGRTRTCLPCHPTTQVTHGQADCIWCHPPHAETKAGPDCRSCHAPAATGTAQAHAEKRLECGACHRIHAAKGGAPPGGACLGCHPKAAKVVGTAHGELDGGPCRTCHPAHEDVEKRPARRHAWEEIFAPDLPCLRCHRDGGDGPVVAHGEHPKSRKKVPTSYGAVVTLETPIVMLGRLQEGGLPLFPLFEDNGRRAMSGRMGCLTCHDPHAGTTMTGEGDGRTPVAYLRDPSGVFLAEICTPCHRGSAGEYARKFHELPRKTD